MLRVCYLQIIFLKSEKAVDCHTIMKHPYLRIYMNSSTYKKIFISLGIILSAINTSLAQGKTYTGFAREFYFGRQLSTRVEAMGQSFVSLDGDASSVNLNPAGLGNLNGIEVSGTYVSPNYAYSKGHKYAVNIASKINDRISVGLSHSRSDLSTPHYILENVWNTLKPSESKVSQQKVALAYTPEETFMLGGSIGVSSFDLANFKANALQLDFGVIKKFEFSRFKNNQSINLATAFKSPVGTTLTLTDDNESTLTVGLPIIMNSGISYYYSTEKKYADLHALQLTAAVEYQTVFNTRATINNYSTGLELSIMEMLHLRGGYYSDNDLNDITYGIGFSLPVDKITELPVNFSLDYCSLPQASFTEHDGTANFHSFSTSLRYILF
jgi:hypothetical protein